MNPAAFCLQRRTLTLVLTAVMLVAGVQSYQGMSRLEDPEFTIKDALVVTPYAGASALEVENEVTDELELAVQQLGQLDDIESRSERGLSTLTVSIENRYDKETLPQVWDELRRKVGDAQRRLPPGAGPSLVIDDYGDVYGVFFAVYGDEYSYAELKQFVDLVRRELALVEDVAKVETFGERSEAIYVEFRRDRVAQLGIPEQVIVDALRQRNLVSDAGRVRVGREFVAIEPTGGADSIEDLEAILIRGGADEQIRLRDVAEIRRGYVEPSDHLIRYDGQQAIGIGISTISGGNVVRMGEAVERRMRELQSQIPLGVHFGIVSVQSRAVTEAIAGFTTSLLQAVAIVIVVLLFFMGLRSGLIIGFVLLLTIVGSFIFLDPMGVALERISLGALIIALGMLVDNAIVVVDGVLVQMQRGRDPESASVDVVAQSSLPLLGATLIAILAFAAIGTSNDSTGEFCRSLFQVVLVSLLLSWVTAVTVTPLLCVLFLKATSVDGGDPYDSRFYRGYRAMLRATIRFRWLTVLVVVALFAGSLRGFAFVEQSFFPPSTRAQLMVDLWLPQGTHIDATTERVAEVESLLAEMAPVTHVTSLVGKGALRFLLTYAPEKANSAYAQLLVDVDGADAIDPLIATIESQLAARYPDMVAYAQKFQLGPGTAGKVRARVSGPDPDALRAYADRIAAIVEADPDAKYVRTDWRERVKRLDPVVAEEAANRNDIQPADIAAAILATFEGASVGVYRDGDLLLPIILRAAADERAAVDAISNVQIWSPAAGRSIPLTQVVNEVAIAFENEIIVRRDRKRTITVISDPRDGPASELHARVQAAVEAIELADGYVLEWGGEYEDSRNAQGPLLASIPFFVVLMVLILVALFDSVRLPVVIFLCVPLALIGVTAGLLATGQPFGFMALLGFLSLIGMLIKNAVVLIDEINLQRSLDRPPLQAILDSGVSRLRPVAMAASTTALGMIPLLTDAFFVAMAVTIIGGLVFATVLTMVVVPVLYAIFFRVPAEADA